MSSGFIRPCTKKSPLQQHEQQRLFWTERVFYNQYQTSDAQWTMTLEDANGSYLVGLEHLFFAIICATKTIQLLLSGSGTAKKTELRAG